MGTREDLLAAAKQCLAELGYARTTVREIVAASGSNLAAINYHFGTRDKLLNQAMIESSAEAVQRIAAALPQDGLDTPATRLEVFWRELIASFTEDRPLWSANIEGIAQALHSPRYARSWRPHRNARASRSGSCSARPAVRTPTAPSARCCTR